MTRSVELTNQCTIRENQKVTLDLRGFTVYGKTNLRIFATWGKGAYLGLVDSSKNHTGKLIARGKKMDQGCGLWIRFGTVDMFGGTLDVSKAQTVKNGTAVLLKEGATFNMYGGTIKGGTSQAVRNAEGKPTNGSGGNIAVTADASFILYNGKVTAGKSNNLGGNMSVSAGAVFTMLGGEISGGTAKTSGKNSNNIIMAAAGTMDLQAGYIQGNVRATNGTVKLSGTIRIADGDGTNLSVNKNSIIKIVGPLTGTQQVGVSGSVVFATGVEEDVSAYFFADTAGKTVVYDPDKKELKLV